MKTMAGSPRRWVFVAGVVCAALLAAGCSSARVTGMSTPTVLPTPVPNIPYTAVGSAASSAAASSASSAPAPSGAPAVEALVVGAMSSLAEAQSVRVTGTLVQAGSRVRLHISFARDVGSTGWIDAGHGKVKVVAVGGRIYVPGGTAGGAADGAADGAAGQARLAGLASIGDLTSFVRAISPSGALTVLGTATVNGQRAAVVKASGSAGHDAELLYIVDKRIDVGVRYFGNTNRPFLVGLSTGAPAKAATKPVASSAPMLTFDNYGAGVTIAVPSGAAVMTGSASC